jgi:hypothetical protein
MRFFFFEIGSHSIVQPASNSLANPCWPQTLNPPAFASQALRLQVCTNMPATDKIIRCLVFASK